MLHVNEVIEFTVVFGVGVLAFARVGTPVVASQYAGIAVSKSEQ